MEHFIINQVQHRGYLAVLVLLILDSACIPIPSEPVLLLGGALAGGLTLAGVQVHLDVVAVALIGAAGAIVGSLVTYAVGRFGGRAVVRRWGHYVFLRADDLDRVEGYFARRGSWAVLVGRLIPGIRAYISFPAGIAEMSPVRFTLLTTLGSLVWTFSLALIGDSVAGHWHAISSDFTVATVVFGAIVVVLIVVWVLRRRRDRRSDDVGTG
jgi:membrane protein DedA with SNARE-associated domain